MSDDRPYPELITGKEHKEMLTLAENLWRDLRDNQLGGFSDGNRPFYIFGEFRRIIERFGHRDTGLKWSKNQLDTHPSNPTKE